MQNIQNKLNEIVQVNEKSTNGIMITLTIDPKEIRSPSESWKYMKKNLPIFMQKLKRKLAIREYIYNREAHNSGYCHSHIFLVLDNPVNCDFLDRKGNKRNRKLTRTIKELWAFHSDIMLASDKNLSKYITLEIGKYTEIETALQRNEKGEIKANDNKALYTHYYAHICNMRLYVASRGLSSDDEEDEGTEPKELLDCLDYYKTNSTIISVSYAQLCYILERKLPPYTVFHPPPEDKSKLLAYITSSNKSQEQIRQRYATITS